MQTAKVGFISVAVCVRAIVRLLSSDYLMGGEEEASSKPLGKLDGTEQLHHLFMFEFNKYSSLGIC